MQEAIVASSRVLEFDSLPSLTAQYARALVRRRVGSGEVPAIEARARGLVIDPARLAAFETLLTRHPITSHHPAANLKIGDPTFPSSTTLIVPVKQHQFRLLNAMFETRTKFESNIFYDVSAWHLPSAFGLLHTALETIPAPAENPRLTPKGSLIGPDPAYAYVFSWTPRYAPTALFNLLSSKVRCWTATRPLPQMSQ